MAAAMEKMKYLSGVRGGTAAGGSPRPPGTPASAAGAQFAADSGSHPVVIPSSCASPREGAHHDSATTDACVPGISGDATTRCDTRPPSVSVGGAATRSAANSAPHPVAVPSGCSSPHKGGGHSSSTSSGVVAPGGSA
jgi:hypothetical protein